MTQSEKSMTIEVVKTTMAGLLTMGHFKCFSTVGRAFDNSSNSSGVRAKNTGRAVLMYLLSLNAKSIALSRLPTV